MKDAFVSRESLDRLVTRWATDRRVFVPVTFDIMNHEETPDYELVRDKVPGTVTLHGAAPAHTPKSFLFYAREVVATYPGAPAEATVEAPPTVLVGPRACDLAALRKYDKVYWSTKHFTEEYDDPFYIEKRERTLIVSLDCTAPKETCFCTKVGGKPHPDDGFDLNLSPVEGGFIVTVGSAKGEKLLEGADNLLTAVSAEHRSERERTRRSVAEAVDRQNAKFEMDGPPDAYDL
ncbi:MAG: hypothetical protein FJY74_04875, partial [Candidatus Eisenbacteria bacterium]|nr:hypothetical protein [Candidatus Eisenbacteria bacterium]